ncbi:uncharacterized protein LOC101859472 [Aplysia californica]|uniref:Uncharacterized protein LOC101859472 n=1 Tax=Aplysia californica TaxID=6500 RepID=A0ABM0ZWP5_APLCA|nr:uncharacterized protein LOC101859472 [Aplysia californica]
MMSLRGLLVCFSLSIHGSYCIKGGTSVDPCNYDGMAVVHLFGSIYCNGVITGGKLVMAESCGTYLRLLTKNFDTNVNFASGSETYTIQRGTYSETVSNGITRVDLPGFAPSGCFKEATLFDKNTQTLDPATCQMVSYGGETVGDAAFDGSLEAIDLTKVAGIKCCKVIPQQALQTEYAKILNKDVPLNCVTSAGAACGVSA